AERGVQLVGTAHGNTLENLMLNPTLADLIGGIQSVTLGDEEARRRGTQKSILERKAPPTFDVVVEIQSWARVAIHENVADTVDALLRGYAAPPEVRQLGPGGRIEIVEETPEQEGETAPYRPSVPVRGAESGGWELGRRRGGGRVRDDRPDEFTHERDHFLNPDVSGMPIRLYGFGVSRGRLDQAIRTLGVNVELVNDVREADAVVTMRNYYRRKPPALREAEERSLPIYVVKNNTDFQLEQVLNQFRNGGSGERAVRRDPMVDVFRETEDAIARVLEEGRPVELAPANSYVRRVQHELATRYNLASKSAGKEPQRRVRILPVGQG
ncbi:MAG: AAA family ATPase, partial [Dehalococcoidia bacterium]|nr:AAA family ATPase [Dehalococcoidia bacterium]